MPKIPLYEQQTKISAETPSVKLDRSAEIQSIQQIANTYAKGVGNLASGINDMVDNYERLEEQSAVADANQEMIDFKLQISKERDEVLKRDDVNLANYEEKYLLPKINEFKQKLNNKGYSPKAMRKLVPVIDTDLGDLRNEEQLTQIKIKQQQHVSTITNEANTFLRTSNRQAGVDILNNAVEDGFILQSEATKLINEADKDYFTLKSEEARTIEDVNSLGDEIIKINDEGKKEVVNQDEVDRWDNMDETIKNSIQATRKTKIRELYKKDTQTIFKTAAEQVTTLEISVDEIRKLKGGNGEPLHPDMINDLLALREAVVNEETLTLSTAEKTSAEFIKFETKIQNLLDGNSENPKKDFEDVIKQIKTSENFSVGLRETYLDELIDFMATDAGYAVFVEGQKGVSVYGGEAETKAWKRYWQIYEDATTYIKDYTGKEVAFKNARKAFTDYINDSRKAATEPDVKVLETRGPGAARTKTAKAEQDAFRARIAGQRGELLEFDNKGNLLMSAKNDSLINAFINNQFNEYRNVQSTIFFNTALNQVVPIGRKTLFNEYYYIPKGAGDPLAFSRKKADELRSMGILEDYELYNVEEREEFDSDMKDIKKIGDDEAPLEGIGINYNRATPA